MRAVYCARALPLCIVCGESLCGVVGAGLQGVQPRAPGVGLVLRRRRMHAGLGGFRSGNRKIAAGHLKGPVVVQRPGGRAGLGALVLRLCGPFRWPGLARGDRSLALAAEGVEVGVELPPPSRHRLRTLR